MNALELHMFGDSCSLQSTMRFVTTLALMTMCMMDGIVVFFRPPLPHPFLERRNQIFLAEVRLSQKNFGKHLLHVSALELQSFYVSANAVLNQIPALELRRIRVFHRHVCCHSRTFSLTLSTEARVLFF